MSTTAAEHPMNRIVFNIPVYSIKTVVKEQSAETEISVKNYNTPVQGLEKKTLPELYRTNSFDAGRRASTFVVMNNNTPQKNPSQHAPKLSLSIQTPSSFPPNNNGKPIFKSKSFSGESPSSSSHNNPSSTSSSFLFPWQQPQPQQQQQQFNTNFSPSFTISSSPTPPQHSERRHSVAKVVLKPSQCTQHEVVSEEEMQEAQPIQEHQKIVIRQIV